MTITIPVWVLWVVGVPVGLILAFCLLVGIVMVFGDGGVNLPW
jgi:hypothetical protein